MRCRGLIDEDFTNYKLPSMFIITPYCDFKCDKENGNRICQNSSLLNEPIIEIEHDKLIQRYLDNKITKAVVFGGLEPMSEFSFREVYWFIHKLRFDYNCFDPVVIYTGYYPEELVDELSTLSKFDNIIVKFGRFKPGHKQHYDEVLGVNLASDNQWAEEL